MRVVISEVNADGAIDLTRPAKVVMSADGNNRIVSLIGQQGPPGPAGGLDFKSQWSSGTAYVLNDVVEAHGSSWVCTSGHTSTSDYEPYVGSLYGEKWGLLASIGNMGPTGPAGEAGQPGLVWRGAWDPDVAYGVGDAVFLNYASYVAINSSTGHQPDGHPEDWDKLVFISKKRSFTFRFNPASLPGVTQMAVAVDDDSNITDWFLHADISGNCAIEVYKGLLTQDWAAFAKISGTTPATLTAQSYNTSTVGASGWYAGASSNTVFLCKLVSHTGQGCIDFTLVAETI